jgi:hypothetical protein
MPADIWAQHLERMRSHPSERLAFMTPAHHRVRNFAVAELPRNNSKALKAEDIARGVQLPLAHVETLLDDLEQHLFFLVRNSAREVSWAYPVTAEETPHHLLFSTGERTFAA